MRDLEGTLARLQALLRTLRFPPDAADLAALRVGSPSACVALLRHAFLRFSRHVSRWLLSAGQELQAKDELRFLESALKALRVCFDYRPALSPAQLMTKGCFAEQKALLCIDALELCKRTHNELCAEHKRAHAPPVTRCDPANLSTALRARVSADGGVGEACAAPRIAVEVLPGSAVASRVERSGAGRVERSEASRVERRAFDGEAALAAPAEEASFAGSFEADEAYEALLAPAFVVPHSRQSQHAGAPARSWRGEAPHAAAPSWGDEMPRAAPSASWRDDAVSVSAQVADRLGALEATLRRMEARLNTLEDAPTVEATEPHVSPHSNNAPAHVYAAPLPTQAAPSRAQLYEPSYAAAFMAPAPVPHYDARRAADAGASTADDDLLAFISGVMARFEDTRALLAAT